MSDAADKTPPFPVEEGHTVRFFVGRYTDAGYFVRWKRGLPLTAFVRVPGETKPRRVPAEDLRPSNDGRMVRLRGALAFTPPPKEVRR